MKNEKAIVLLSGGLDSAVTLYFAKSKGYKAKCLIFDYGQRHKKEISQAKKIVKYAGCDYKVIKISLPWKGSSLLDKRTDVYRSTSEIPSTYVPARNIIFLSFALSYAEAIGAKKIFIGAHTHDYSGYPDCRPEFYHAFKRVISKGTKVGVQRRPIQIETPLINKNKTQIIKLGQKLGVPFGLTWSCYEGKHTPCGKCDSCFYREKGFKEAGFDDPLLRVER